MMIAWSFAARSVDEVARLIRTLSKNRYVSEVDHRIHWAVDKALANRQLFAPHAKAFEERLARDPTLDPSSRAPSLWRPAGLEEVISALEAFWTPGDEAVEYRSRLKDALKTTNLPEITHEPFACPADQPPHPELILLDWVLYPVDELDVDRHAGALSAMEEAEEEVNASAPIYNEGPILAAPELCLGAPAGVLAGDFLVWSDGPYSYADYVFRGASKAAKLLELPIGLRDFEEADDE